MYLRFITIFDKESGERETGIFQAAGYFAESGSLNPEDKEKLRELGKWFGKNLKRPEKFSKSKKPHTENTGLSWFKDTSSEYLKNMYDLKSILEKQDLIIEVIKSRNPGYIVYEDDHQIVVIPYTKELGKVK